MSFLRAVKTVMVIVCPLVMTAETSLQMEEEEIDGGVLFCIWFVLLLVDVRMGRVSSFSSLSVLLCSLHFFSGGLSISSW